MKYTRNINNKKQINKTKKKRKVVNKKKYIKGGANEQSRTFAKKLKRKTSLKKNSIKKTVISNFNKVKDSAYKAKGYFKKFRKQRTFDRIDTNYIEFLSTFINTKLHNKFTIGAKLVRYRSLNEVLNLDKKAQTNKIHYFYYCYYKTLQHLLNLFLINKPGAINLTDTSNKTTSALTKNLFNDTMINSIINKLNKTNLTDNELDEITNTIKNIKFSITREISAWTKPRRKRHARYLIERCAHTFKGLKTVVKDSRSIRKKSITEKEIKKQKTAIISDLKKIKSVKNEISTVLGEYLYSGKRFNKAGGKFDDYKCVIEYIRINQTLFNEYFSRLKYCIAKEGLNILNDVDNNSILGLPNLNSFDNLPIYNNNKYNQYYFNNTVINSKINNTDDNEKLLKAKKHVYSIVKNKNLILLKEYKKKKRENELKQLKQDKIDEENIQNKKLDSEKNNTKLNKIINDIKLKEAEISALEKEIEQYNKLVNDEVDIYIKLYNELSITYNSTLQNKNKSKELTNSLLKFNFYDYSNNNINNNLLLKDQEYYTDIKENVAEMMRVIYSYNSFMTNYTQKIEKGKLVADSIIINFKDTIYTEIIYKNVYGCLDVLLYYIRQYQKTNIDLHNYGLLHTSITSNIYKIHEITQNNYKIGTTDNLNEYMYESLNTSNTQSLNDYIIELEELNIFFDTNNQTMFSEFLSNTSQDENITNILNIGTTKTKTYTNTDYVSIIKKILEHPYFIMAKGADRSSLGNLTRKLTRRTGYIYNSYGSKVKSNFAKSLKFKGKKIGIDNIYASSDFDQHKIRKNASISDLSTDIEKVYGNLLTLVELGVFYFMRNTTFNKNYESVFSTLPLVIENIFTDKRDDDKILEDVNNLSDLFYNYAKINNNNTNELLKKHMIDLLTYDDMLSLSVVKKYMYIDERGFPLYDTKEYIKGLTPKHFDVAEYDYKNKMVNQPGIWSKLKGKQIPDKLLYDIINYSNKNKKFQKLSGGGSNKEDLSQKVENIKGIQNILANNIDDKKIKKSIKELIKKFKNLSNKFKIGSTQGSIFNAPDSTQGNIFNAPGGIQGSIFNTLGSTPGSTQGSIGSTQGSIGSNLSSIGSIGSKLGSKISNNEKKLTNRTELKNTNNEIRIYSELFNSDNKNIMSNIYNNNNDGKNIRLLLENYQRYVLKWSYLRLSKMYNDYYKNKNYKRKKDDKDITIAKIVLSKALILYQLNIIGMDDTKLTLQPLYLLNNILHSSLISVNPKATKKLRGPISIPQQGFNKSQQQGFNNPLYDSTSQQGISNSLQGFSNPMYGSISQLQGFSNSLQGLNNPIYEEINKLNTAELQSFNKKLNESISRLTTEQITDLKTELIQALAATNQNETGTNMNYVFTNIDTQLKQKSSNLNQPNITNTNNGVSITESDLVSSEPNITNTNNGVSITESDLVSNNEVNTTISTPVSSQPNITNTNNGVRISESALLDEKSNVNASNTTKSEPIYNIANSEQNTITSKIINLFESKTQPISIDMITPIVDNGNVDEDVKKILTILKDIKSHFDTNDLNNPNSRTHSQSRITIGNQIAGFINETFDPKSQADLINISNTNITIPSELKDNKSEYELLIYIKMYLLSKHKLTMTVFDNILNEKSANTNPNVIPTTYNTLKQISNYLPVIIAVYTNGGITEVNNKQFNSNNTNLNTIFNLTLGEQTFTITTKTRNNTIKKYDYTITKKTSNN